MQTSSFNTYRKIFAKCHHILGTETWGRIWAALADDPDPATFPEQLLSLKARIPMPAFIVDLARIEWCLHRTGNDDSDVSKTLESVAVNPTLTLLQTSWNHLAEMVSADTGTAVPPPQAADGHVLIWRHPETLALRIREAGDIDLLALKLVVEQIDVREAAATGRVNVAAIDSAIEQAVTEGILLSPGSRIRRPVSPGLQVSERLSPFLAADTFTLQWHITQTCDLHCRHCYDRSERTPLPPETAIAILDDFDGFCRQMHVRGQVTFTGGNPLLYPHFFEVYRAASDRGFGLAILGNPTPERQIQRLIDIARPLYFQISLEGLAAANDYIRGAGHFERSLAFLDTLRRLDIYTMVMLTLTRDNLEQVLPLGDLLRDRADCFTFNRLSTVGEGAQLAMPDPDAFQDFLRTYRAAAQENPVLRLKDNLINIIHREKGLEFFGGCTGFGCGAAFNFVALLADGEVHACRKFPSPIGNMLRQPLAAIYGSEAAEKYRSGSRACRDCELNAVCRGCLAIAYSCGLDVFTEKDPFCFI